MIKPIQTNEIFNTPFTTNKSWSLNSSSSILTVEEGYFVSSSYNFYDTSSAALYGYTADEQNSNGSYKRLVYQLVKNSYYNPNIGQSFGLETTDTDKVFKILQNTCVRMTLPRIYFGETILKDSVLITDFSKDKNYIIYDDTYGNLFVDGTHFINYVDFTSSAYSAPVIDFSSSPTSGYAPLTVILTPSIQGNITEYYWDLGDGTTSTSSAAITHTYIDPGQYTVSLIGTGIGGTSSKTRRKYISANVLIPPPEVDFSFTPSSGYVPSTITFTNQTTNASNYIWNFGDGLTSTLENPTHEYTASGIFSVSLTAYGGGGEVSTTKFNCIEIIPIPVPIPNFVASSTTGYATISSISFINGTTSFNPATYPVTYSWDFGDGTNSNLTNPTKIYSTPGTYTVSLSASNAGGTGSLSKLSYITISSVAVPVASFTVDTSSGDLPLQVQFTDTSTGVAITSWNYNFGDLTTSALQNPSHTYTTAGTYSVSSSVSNAGGSDVSDITTIKVYDPSVRLIYTPHNQLMNWSTNVSSITNGGVTLANFTSSIIDPINVEVIQVNSTANPITTIQNTNYYTSMKLLDLSNQNLTSISGIGVNTLETLVVNNNSNLTSINVSDLPNIKGVSSNSCNLSGTFTISGVSTLQQLAVGDNNITTLDITGNTGLTALFTYQNTGLTSITGFSTCTNLTYLQLWNCDLRGTGATPIDFTALTKLTLLQISGNPNLQVINVSTNPDLRELICQDDGISTINLTNNTELTRLWINGNNLSTLDLTSNKKLKSLYIYQNTSLGLPTGFSSLVDLEILNTYNCNITTNLDVTPFTKLKTFYAGAGPGLPSINMSTCTLLELISVRNATLITTLNLPTSLTYTKSLSADGCALPSSEINSILTKLDANGITGGVVILNGGTNGAPTGVGIGAKASLIAKGWTVTTN